MAVNHQPYGPGAMNPLSLCRGDESSLHIYIEAMNSLSLSLCRGDECQGDESSLSLSELRKMNTAVSNISTTHQTNGLTAVY